MFTLNAKLIEQAAASGNPRDFTQAFANCAAPLQHRGPISNSALGGGSALGAGQYPEGYAIGGPQVDLNFINIEIPPWQNIPFVPTPLVDMPSSRGNARWPEMAEDGIGTWGGDSTGAAGRSGAKRSSDGGAATVSGAQPALSVSGNASLGNTSAKSVSTDSVRSGTISARQSISNRGTLRNAGGVTVGTPRGSAAPGKEASGSGGIHNYGDSYTGGNVTHVGQTFHRGTVNNSFVTNNQTVNNYGPTNSFSTSNHYSTAHFYGPVNSYNTAIYRSDAYYQNLFAEGDGKIDQDLVVGRNATVNGDLLTHGNVHHSLGDGNDFRVTAGPATKLVSIDVAAPPVPAIQARWFNVQLPAFLGGDTYLWRNYLYVSTAGNAATYTKLDLQKIDFVTGVTWDGDKLRVIKTPYWVLAKADVAGPATTVILDCPI